MQVIDLRSDTITLPTEEMRRAMYEAEVGDDSRGEDPTVKRLEELAAEITGKESAVLVASGTMGNLVSVLTHCRRGDEVIMGSLAHMYWFEAAGTPALAGVQPRLVPNDTHGRLDPEDVRAAIRSEAVFSPRTTLVCLENTHNGCSGGVLSRLDMKAVCDVAHQHGIPVHLDGARIFNAAVYLDVPAAELAQDVDDLTFCLSKGLSAPAGSLVCGSASFIREARRARQMVGGAMRQGGVIAAAGIVALNTMIDRLAEDHEKARRLALGLAQIPGISLNPEDVQTNIIMVKQNPGLGTPQEFLQILAEKGVKALSPRSGHIRMVTNRHISAEDIDQALLRIKEAVQEALGATTAR